jgi:hypothetical protein
MLVGQFSISAVVRWPIKKLLERLKLASNIINRLKRIRNAACFGTIL